MFCVFDNDIFFRLGFLVDVSSFLAIKWAVKRSEAFDCTSVHP